MSGNGHAPHHLLVLTLEGRRFALPLSAVERVVRAVEVTPLPQAPPSVLGVINLQGQVIPVLSLRGRCGLPEREVDPAHQFVIAHAGGRTVALAVDRADVIAVPNEAVTEADHMLPGLLSVHDVVKGPDGLVVLYDPDRLLSLQEGQALERAVQDVPGPERGSREGGADE